MTVMPRFSLRNGDFENISLTTDQMLSQVINRLAGKLGKRLARVPRIAIMGEVNSGKSTLINAVLGAPLMPTSIEANTKLPTRLYYSARPEVTLGFADQRLVPLDGLEIDPQLLDRARMIHVGLPIQKLTVFELIDTPSFESGEDRLGERARYACRQSDIAVWCTTAMQAWKASEAAIWHSVPQRVRARALLAVTFKDAVATVSDEARLMARLTTEAGPHFGAVTLVSARNAIRARRETDDAIGDRRLKDSGADALASAIDETVSKLMMDRLRSAEHLLTRAMNGPAFDGRLRVAAAA